MVESRYVSKDKYQSILIRKRITFSLGFIVLAGIILAFICFVIYFQYNPHMQYNYKNYTDPVIFVVMICFYLLRTGLPYRNTLKLFDKYSNIVFNLGITSLSQIASFSHAPVSLVLSDLTELIDNKLFVNVYIDTVSESIVLKPLTTGAYKEHTSHSITDIVCKKCGASNPKSNKECEYCSSPLK